jgi:glycosyltransferase involved in cell wall biosynthesis
MVMPVYNKIKYIDMMLESVYNQIWDSIELILVNDGAIDGTRERLSEWEPRFKSRGYEVVIIDQENQGIPGAVKVGLLNITGDYVCVVDCDDMLDPEYVSVMAEWLDKHPDDDWTSCLWSSFVIENGSYKKQHTLDICCLPTPPDMMEKYLSAKYTAMIWIYMVRTDYLKGCRVAEGFITDIRSTQEPGFLLPLILGNGKLKVIERSLYNHNIYDDQASARKSASYTIEYQNKYRDISKRVIDNLNVDASLKAKWRIMAELAHKGFTLQSLSRLPDNNDYILKLASEAVDLISIYFKPNPHITVAHILEYGYEHLSSAMFDCIIGTKPLCFPKITGRVIGCGANGKSGRRRLPELLGMPYMPTELWDRSATPGDIICGIPITAPDYSTIGKDDVALVFPVEASIKTEIVGSLKKRAVKILLYEDIMKYIRFNKYSQFYNKCRFEVQP